MGDGLIAVDVQNMVSISHFSLSIHGCGVVGAPLKGVSEAS